MPQSHQFQVYLVRLLQHHVEVKALHTDRSFRWGFSQFRQWFWSRYSWCEWLKTVKFDLKLWYITKHSSCLKHTRFQGPRCSGCWTITLWTAQPTFSASLLKPLRLHWLWWLQCLRTERVNELDDISVSGTILLVLVRGLHNYVPAFLNQAQGLWIQPF